MTLYMVDVAALRPWAEALSRELGMTGSGAAGVFASRRGASVRFHFDFPELFTIQLRGRKRWTIAENPRLQHPGTGWVTGRPVPHELRFYAPGQLPAAPAGRKETVDLRPGSVLYLPRGYWHATKTIEDSLSIELSLPTDSWADLVLDGLRTALISKQEWREAAVGAWGNERQRARARRRLASLMAGLGDDLERLRAEDLIDPPRGRAVELSGRFRRNPTATFGVEGTLADGGALVRFIRKGLRELHETEAEVDEQVLELCRWILSRRTSFTGEEARAAAPGLDAGEVLELLDFLLDLGLVREDRATAS